MTAPLFAKKTHSSEDYRPSFVEKLNEWKRKTGGLTEADYADFDRALKRNKEIFVPAVELS